MPLGILPVQSPVSVLILSNAPKGPDCAHSDVPLASASNRQIPKAAIRRDDFHKLVMFPILPPSTLPLSCQASLAGVDRNVSFREARRIYLDQTKFLSAKGVMREIRPQPLARTLRM